MGCAPLITIFVNTPFIVRYSFTRFMILMIMFIIQPD